MTNDTRFLLLQIAGFLTLVSKGLIPEPLARKEASELLDKIGDAVAEKDAAS